MGTARFPLMHPSLIRYNRGGTILHTRCTGVGLYISDRLKYKTRDDLIAVTEECPFECLFIEAEVDKNAIVIGTVYKPPDTNVNTFRTTHGAVS